MIVMSKSFQDFICNCDNKIANYLNKYLNHSCYNVYQKLFTTEEINYLTFRNDGTISFLPKGKEHQENDDGTWKRDGRQNGKPSKVIQKIITPFGRRLFNEKDFENFTNCYKVEFNTEDLRFELLPNKKIGYIYLSEAVEGEGSLNNSCMRSVDSDYFDIYTHCKDLQILVLKKEELIAGRALIWKIEDITLMDRIYTAKEHYFEMFFKYAKENNYWRKAEQSYNNKETFINLEGERIEKNFKIYTDTEFDNYPYIDTFTYGQDGILTNNSSSYEYEYTETDGSRNGSSDDNHDDETWDSINDEYINNEDAIEVTRGRYRNEYTYINNTVIDVDGDVWWEEDADIIEIGREWYPTDHEDIIYDSINGEYILTIDSVEITKGSSQGELTVESETTKDFNGDVWADCDIDVLITKIDGDWYCIEDVIELEESYYLPDSDEIELINGKYQLKTEVYA